METSHARRPTYHQPGEPASGSPVAAVRKTSRPSSPVQHASITRGRLLANATSATALSRSSSPLVVSSSSSSPPPTAAPSLTPVATPAGTAPSSRMSSRMSRLRSRSPPNSISATANTRRKYTYAAFFLVLSLISFTVQTELSSIIQHDLGWDKAYCMMYFTHGSWSILWPLQLALLRLQRRDVPWSVFWRRHVQLLRSTALMTQTQRLDVTRASAAVVRSGGPSPAMYLVRTTAMIAVSLTVAGLSWYIAVDMTSPADLTAIYNCSAFFAYAFSIPILKERVRLDKVIAVGVAIVGVLVVAYGDAGSDEEQSPEAGRRFLGNIVIGVGSVLYGLYEVLYKRYACPPEGVSPNRGMMFAITVASCIGFFTLSVLWIPLPILHILGIETFELPTGHTARLVLVAVLSNAVFSGSFLVLISLTSPVLSSVASLVTIFLVAVADWFLKHKALSSAAIAGGLLIVIAFLVLSWSSYKEMVEHEGVEPVDVADSSDADESGEEDEDALLRG